MLVLDAEEREVVRARSELAKSLDELERRLAPNNIAKVAWWWAKGNAKAHPIAWTIGGVAVMGLVAGLISWAVVDDSED